MARFFIDRPILSMVISIIITLAGCICIPNLPVSQYPDVVPPMVRIGTRYRGANAQDVEKTVAQPIEQQMIGLDGLLYIASNSANDGTCNIDMTFEVGTNLDNAVVQAQNKVKLAEPLLPQEVRQDGINVKKMSTGFLMVIVFNSPDRSYDALFLNNYVRINVLDKLGTITGVGEASLASSIDYSMRVWLNPDKLSKMGLNVDDVRTAVLMQNRQSPAGTIGKPPGKKGIDIQYPVNAPGRLEGSAEFGDIVVRAQPDGSLVRIRDVGRVELGAVDYVTFNRFNGAPTAAITISQMPGANAVATARAIEKELKDLSKNFPKGIEYRIPYDTTMFVKASIEEVIATLFEAIVLVILVVFLFLQNWRATLIPLLTVPVSLLGTFALFPVLGFSINMVSLFGLVLAIGIVVDDAIVVVEAVQHNMDHFKLSPREATIKAMDEVSGPVVAIALILAGVFVPVSFLGGITGQIYRQFALTIAGSVLLSALCALTLSPALSSLLLRPATRMRGPLGWFFRKFNDFFGWGTDKYVSAVWRVIRHYVLFLLILLGLYACVAWMFKAVPTGFLPDEDQGAFFTLIRLPDGASLERTEEVSEEVEKITQQAPGVSEIVTLGGYDISTATGGTNVSSLIVTLKPWDERKTPDEQLNAILAALQKKYSKVQGALVFAFGPPPIIGLSNSGGFEFVIQDRASRGINPLAEVTDAVIADASKRPQLTNLSSPLRANVPQLSLVVDRDKARTLGVPLTDVYDSLQTYLGSVYINDFNLYGRTWKVVMQADSEFRRTAEDINRFFVRSDKGAMVPLSTLVTVKDVTGPDVVYRYDRFLASKITGAARPPYSSGQANAAIEQAATDTMPAGYAYQWTGTVYQEKKSQGQEPIIFGLSSILVFLLLAALYESWSTPFAVILAVPLGILGALLACMSRGYPYDVYTQIGIVTLIGLAAKNAILIVEFAEMGHEKGMPPDEAAVDAARLRLRPILMTSLAFILGVIPLMVAAGAGSGSRRALGTAVFGGMNGATFLAIFFVPMLFVFITKMARRKSAKQTDDIASK